MEIAQIKAQLDILQVAAELGIQPDKHGKAKCPFHADGKPSLQFSREKQICTCFSSRCDAGTMDVIGLTEKKLNTSTHGALKYLTELAGGMPITKANQPKPEAVDYAKDFELMQSSFVASSTARNYAESRNLDWQKLEIGYNAFKNARFNYLKGCVVFPLKDETGKVVSLYGRSVRENDKRNAAQARHYYTADRKGLYPSYPKLDAKKLILTESIIDAATLLSIPEVTENFEVLAQYGTNGLTAEHDLALQKLEILEEIVLFFDGDEAGKAATQKQGSYLKAMFPNLKISTVETPEGEDINSLATGHEPAIFNHLLKERKPFFFSVEESPKGTENQTPLSHSSTNPLNTENPNKLVYCTETATYFIKGGIRKELDSLKVTLVIENRESKAKSRTKLDLYEDRQAEKASREAAEKLNLRADLIERDLSILTDLLDDYREEQQEETEEKTQQILVTGSQKEKCLHFLKSPNLLENINGLIGKSGVVGEENNRLFLFGIASSYKMPDTLHALIQGSSGSGKTHLLASIMGFMPKEDTISLTRVTESSFYNYGQYELSHKLIGMEDYDGLEEKAELAFRELQSKGMISSSTSGKDEKTGEINGYVKTVYGPIASLSATTRGDIYEDNLSRCFLVAVDESQEQTLRIISYQNQKSAGLIDKQQEAEAKQFLQDCIRLLKPYEVVNPFANQIELPKEAHKIRRLNDLFQSYVRQITLLNQYQRRKDQQGRLITEKEDVKTAIEILFDSIVLKVDELDGSLRSFYEELKKYVIAKGKSYEFIQREIRHALNVSKTQLFRHVHSLEELEYVQKKGFGSHGAVKYRISYWDDNQAMRSKIKENLNQQLERL